MRESRLSVAPGNGRAAIEGFQSILSLSVPQLSFSVEVIAPATPAVAAFFVKLSQLKPTSLLPTAAFTAF